MRKFFYFRTEAAVGDDDDIATSVMFPVDNLISMYPTSDTALTLTIKPALPVQADGQDGAVINNDTIILNVNTNAHREVMYAIAQAANATVSKIFLHPDITGVSGYTSDTDATGLATAIAIS